MSVVFADVVSAGDEYGWRLKLNGASIQATAGGGFDPSFGFGLAVGYRVSPRLGIELSATTAELESEVTFEGAVSPFHIAVVSAFDTTPVLARINWHLTPHKKVDVYLGPVAGWVRYSDVMIRIEGDFEVIHPTTETRIETKDRFAWGAHAGVDIPFGNTGWFWNGGITLLKAEVESDSPDSESFDLDPLVAHVGLGFRF